MMGETGTTPGGRGRFTGFDVLREAGTWDAETAGVVLGRLRASGDLRFFTSQDAGIARCLLDRLLAQDDEPRIPVLEDIDRRLADGDGDGWRHEEMPEDPEAWHRSLVELDRLAQHRTGGGFCELDRRRQDDLIEHIRTADRLGDMPAAWVWNLWMRYALAAFYAHPWSWNEIGFGGPAYPRGYKSLGLDALEPWERRESRPRDPEPWAQRVERARRL